MSSFSEKRHSGVDVDGGLCVLMLYGPVGYYQLLRGMGELVCPEDGDGMFLRSHLLYRNQHLMSLA